MGLYYKGHEFSRELKRGPFAWPGGYELILLMTDGEVICYNCAVVNAVQIRLAAMTKAKDGWRPAMFIVHWEGPPELCASCNREIASEYGDPDQPVEG